jgi:hypothetical protein
MTDAPYAAAQITFLDRESQKKTAYTYPVTEVVLRNLHNPEPGRTFRPDEEGVWREVT